jgi:hypothetical protein
MSTPAERAARRWLISPEGGEAAIRELAAIIEEETHAGALRKLLWLRHGCPISALYGDDGEMQCGRCCIDFKRSSAVEIEQLFMAIAAAKGER